MKQQKLRGGFGFFTLLLCLALLGSLALPVGATAAGGERQKLYVGGTPFGVRYFTDGILVVGYCDVTSGGRAQNPAKEAGIKPGDAITEIGGKAPDGVADLCRAIEGAGGKALTLTVRRDGASRTVTLSPCACDSDGRYRTGLWVRDTGAGIGTVTYMLDNGRDFGGLGHGICDGASGCLVPIARGTVMGVKIADVQRGAIGAPGELKGHFSDGKLGALGTNTTCGVYGVLTERPADITTLLPVGRRDEIHEGAAKCRCTLDEGAPREYDIKISDIHRTARDNKCFTVTVTDKALLEKTGGIVQGMSGSPIIQDGKLVGAITHVLIGDPTTGYGIFIENMLENMPRTG